ncbi:MAG TPA: Asd/ArgC dimerization domain-containing protein [Terriglobia bacterium]|jgi:aspartate-semialdehyde dehydrogenase
MPVDAPFQWNVALVGASSLKGKELKSVFEDRGFPLGKLALLDAGELQGQLTEFDGEPAIVEAVSRESFEKMDVALFACAPAFTEQHWREAEAAGCRVLDLSYFLESHPGARLRAPLVEPLWEDAARRPVAPGPGSGSVVVAAHPAAMAIAGILALLSRRASVVRSSVLVLEPVSEHGRGGVDELHRQTVSLLSFQELPRKVFDSQVAFNLLSRYGEESRPSLREAQERIASHLRRLLDGRSPAPALRLLQAPVFHGYCFSFFVELSDTVPAEEIEAALNHKPFCLAREGDVQPDVVGAAGSDEILLGAVERDPACGAGYWIWGALDNLRVAALNAELVAEEMVHAEGRGNPPGKAGSAEAP